MRYMLDTNIISDMIRNPAGKAAMRSQQVDDEALCVSIITAAELRFGAAHRASPRLTARIEQLLGELTVLALEAPADATYAGIRLALEQAGQPIGPNDLLVAAHAITVGAVLVTANSREFGRVRGLKVENWLGA